jgi:dienelactone hydrolase
MSQIALFHPSFGVSPGVVDAAERLRADGHKVLVVDQYDGRVFDDYEEAGRFVDGIGFPELMRRAVEACAGLDDGFVAAGFSNGGGMAEYVATQRRVGGVVMMSGAMPVTELGAEGWPAGVPAQIHYSVDDPRRAQDWLDETIAQIRAAGATVDFFEYPGDGHLFTDPSRADEYDAEAAALLWPRVLAFCRAHG